jgi:hypothetical protein
VIDEHAHITGHLTAHLTNETLLLYAGEEVSEARADEIRAHLAECARCEARLEEVRRTLAEFSSAHRQAFDSKLPSAAHARAALRSRMEELNAQTARSSWAVRMGFGRIWLRRIGIALTPGRPGYALAAVIVFVVLLAALYRHEIRSGSQQISASLGLWVEPRATLTPGATLPLTRAQVCESSTDAAPPVVPVSLKSKVLTLYGVNATSSEDYEVDYLITPELGGATDVRNLWPEPYYDTTWNAHVKDQLEDRLHQMVCHGDLDLATAQQDISKDWIAAYRKYFHTDQPLATTPPSHRL